MVDTYSPDKTRVVNQTEGGNNNSWGQILDASLESLARATGGLLAKAITGNTTLTLTEAQHAFIRLTGTLSAAAIIEIPGYTGAYIIQNATTGGFKVTVKTAAGAGVDVNAGARRWLFCDATDVISVQTALQADQNLADLANVATARTNLGLGALAVLNSVTAGQIDPDAVDTSEIKDGASTWAKLAAGIFNQSTVTPQSTDKLIGADASDAGNKAAFTIADILALVPSGATPSLASAGSGTSIVTDGTGPDFTVRGFTTSVTNATSGSGAAVANVDLAASWSHPNGTDMRLNLTLTRYYYAPGVGVGVGGL